MWSSASDGFENASFEFDKRDEGVSELTLLKCESDDGDEDDATAPGEAGVVEHAVSSRRIAMVENLRFMRQVYIILR